MDFLDIFAKKSDEDTELDNNAFMWLLDFMIYIYIYYISFNKCEKNKILEINKYLNTNLYNLI